MFQEQNNKDLEYLNNTISECNIMKYIGPRTLKIKEEVFILSMHKDCTKVYHFLDHRSPVFARMGSPGIFHALTVHVSIGRAILEKNLAIANKTGKSYALGITTSTFRKFLFVVQGFIYKGHTVALFETVKNWKYSKCP